MAGAAERLSAQLTSTQVWVGDETAACYFDVPDWERGCSMLKNQHREKCGYLTFGRAVGLLLVALVAISSAKCTTKQGAADSSPLGKQRQAVRCGNGLGVMELALNAISTNRGALDQLVSNTLTTATFSSTGPDVL